MRSFSSSKSTFSSFKPLVRKQQSRVNPDDSLGSELEEEDRGISQQPTGNSYSTPSGSRNLSFSFDFSPVEETDDSSLNKGANFEEEEKAAFGGEDDEERDESFVEEFGERDEDNKEEDVEESSGHERSSASSSSKDEIILSLCLAYQKLGAAYYDSSTHLLYLLNDLTETTTDLRLIESLILQVNPTTVLANSRQDVELMEELKRHCEFSYLEVSNRRKRKRDEDDEASEDADAKSSPNTEESDSSHSKPVLLLLANASFGIGEAKRRLEDLICDSKCNETEKGMQIQFAINTDSNSMVRAAGALLKYLEIKRIGVELEDLSVTTPISGLRTITLEKMVEVDQETLEALQIFQLELHPSAYKFGRSGGFKEGLSIFGLCNKCGSTPGKAELRRWFGRPVMNLEVLLQRQKAISFFMVEPNLHMAAELIRALRSVKQITGILKRLKRTQASVGDWRTLYKTVFSMVQIAGMMRTRRTHVEMLDEMSLKFSDELSRIGLLLDEMLDLPDMHKENRFVVRRGIDEDLDQKKKEFEHLPEFLSAVAAKEMRNLEPYLSELSVIYVPILGYLICVPRTSIRPHVDDHVVPGLEFVFRTGEQVHYKNSTMHELDDTIGDVKFQIIDAETSLMLRLQEIVVESGPILIQAVRIVAQLDCLLALASVAREKEWVRPELTADESVIDVVEAVHPLLSQVSCNAVVSNPVKSGGSNGRIKILTGPNASGKSVYLKQVGLIVYLAHLGSFVPAKSAKIGLVDRIFTRMHSGDCVLDGMSTFCKDLQQMAFALRRATGKSLVVVDEFGKGTMAEVGMALLASALNYWKDSERGCPHVFVCSHFHAIASLVAESEIANYQTMDVLRQGHDLVFLFQLVDGVIGHSYAAYAAMMAGLPEYIVKRGFQVYKSLKRGEPITRRDMVAKEIARECNFLSVIAKSFAELNLEKNAIPFLKLVKEAAKREEAKKEESRRKRLERVERAEKRKANELEKSDRSESRTSEESGNPNEKLLAPVRSEQEPVISHKVPKESTATTSGKILSGKQSDLSDSDNTTIKTTTSRVKPASDNSTNELKSGDESAASEEAPMAIDKQGSGTPLLFSDKISCNEDNDKEKDGWDTKCVDVVQTKGGTSDASVERLSRSDKTSDKEESSNNRDTGSGASNSSAVKCASSQPMSAAEREAMFSEVRKTG